MLVPTVSRLLVLGALAISRAVTALPEPVPAPQLLAPRASETPHYSSVASANAMTSAAYVMPPMMSNEGGYPDDDDYDFPTLPPINSDFLASLSSIDSSINLQVSSAIAGMTTNCVGVPDISGTPVTLCGPTAESATGTLKSSGLAVAGARATLEAVAVAVGIVGGLVV
jgi:hypothetical protein